MPNGHSPGPWNCPSPSPARSQARSSLSMPRTRSGSMPNFSTQSCQVSAGGVCTGRPSARASRSWYGAVRTTAVACSRSSSGTESGSNNRNSSPTWIPYDETSSGHHSSLLQSGCGVCQCQTPGRTSRMGPMLVVPGYGRRRWRVVEASQVPTQGRLKRLGAHAAGDIVQLPGVFLQVVELAPAVLVLDVQAASRLDGDVWRRTAFVQQVLAEVLLEPRVAPGSLLAVEERDEAATVLRQLRLDPGQLADGGSEVDVEHGLVVAHRLGRRGGTDDHRDVRGLLVGPDLAAETMLAPEEAVVARVEDHGVVQLVSIFELLDDAADAAVESEERLLLPDADVVDVELCARAQHVLVPEAPWLLADVALIEVRRVDWRDVLQLALVTLGRDRREVRRDRSEVEEERVARVVDEVDGFVRQDRGRVVRLLVPVVLDMAVVVDRVVVVRLHRDAVHDLPVIPTGWNLVVNEPVRIGVDVLADESGLVAGLVHPDREVVRLFPGLERGVAVPTEVVEDAGVVRVLARKDARPRWPAHRGRNVGIGEGDAVAGEQLLDVLHHARPIRALVVAQDHDDVQPLVDAVLVPGRELARRGADSAEDEQQRRRHRDPYDPPQRLQRIATCQALFKTSESVANRHARRRYGARRLERHKPLNHA